VDNRPAFAADNIHRCKATDVVNWASRFARSACKWHTTAVTLAAPVLGANGATSYQWQTDMQRGAALKPRRRTNGNAGNLGEIRIADDQ